jgi:hypothetical protein
MRICGRCGNDFEGGGDCPYCGAFEMPSAGGRRKKPKKIVTLNLEKGLPRVEEAVASLDRQIAAARMEGVTLMRVIHGWGSTGTGGKIKAAVHLQLGAHTRSRNVRGFLPGERYSELTSGGKNLLASYPSLRSTLRSDRENPGITFVEL